MDHRAGGVQDYYYEVAGSGDCDYLLAAAFAIFGTFDDTWQI
jgi:hypothetical protein